MKPLIMQNLCINLCKPGNYILSLILLSLILLKKKIKETILTITITLLVSSQHDDEKIWTITHFLLNKMNTNPQKVYTEWRKEFSNKSDD